MSKMIFVNLPVADLPAAMAFYEAIGAENNPMFTDETAACMVFSDTIYVMLLTHEKFAQFTTREIADSHKVAAHLLALSADSREGVDQVADAAIAAGGRQHRDTQDMGFMYSRAFEDLDGHVWEPMFMDTAAATQAMAPQGETAEA